MNRAIATAVDRRRPKGQPTTGLNPRGHLDRHGNWWPEPVEVQSCCKGMGNRPTPQHRWKLWQHCKTIRHVANCFDVPYRELVTAVQTSERSMRLAPAVTRKKSKAAATQAKAKVVGSAPFLPPVSGTITITFDDPIEYVKVEDTVLAPRDRVASLYPLNS